MDSFAFKIHADEALPPFEPTEADYYEPDVCAVCGTPLDDFCLSFLCYDCEWVDYVEWLKNNEQEGSF